MADNPYQGIADHQFWSRGVALAAPGQLDPMIGGVPIGAADRVVTMGSCFAQHLARNLAGLGLNYYLAEAPPADMQPHEAQRRNYGMFSARFGNIYTVRQAVQLFDRAFGRFTPADDVWPYEGGYVDAFRPQIDPVPFQTEDAVREAAQSHLARVRDMFQSADWLILTLGLTEGWRSAHDGAVYPVAPGVAGGNYDVGRYEFVNFSAEAVRFDLIRFVDCIKQVNPGCQIILTVSPVPLIATYSPRHVLTATTYSKAVLRVAADEVERLKPNVTYFPSYEIITAQPAEGRYFEDDLRSVSEIGVAHVMRVFRRHFVATGAATADTASVVTPAAIASFPHPVVPTNVICDEDLIEQSIQASGMGGPSTHVVPPGAATIPTGNQNAPAAC